MNRVLITMITGLAVTAGVVMAGEETSWADKIKLGGDLRYRHEYKDVDEKVERHRQRIRLRVSASAEVNDALKVMVRLASGSDDPVSSNQTLDDFGSSKSLNLDRGYFAWSVMEGVELLGGKMAKPFICVSDLIWDGDYNPEGLAAKAEMGALMASAGYLWIDERSGDEDDGMLYVGQVAGQMDMDDISVLVGASLYYYDNLEGEALYDGDSFGNSTVTVGEGDDAGEVFATGFEEIEGFAQIKMNMGMPVTLYGQYVVNEGADDNDTGYLAGVSLGKAKAAGSMAVGYNYRDLEADAVLGALSDSDMAGGGSDIKGHKISAKYQIAKNWQLAAAYLIGEAAGSTDYNTLQVDLVAKF